MFKSPFLLRFAVVVILLMHSLPSIISGDIKGFGGYLNESGFAPFGLLLAWAIKLSHIASAICLAVNKFVKPACIVSVIILIVGIFKVHLPDGWFVVGGGRNGVEFNFLLIFVLLTIMYPSGFVKKPGVKATPGS